MFCPKCGGQNPEDGKFCRSCGTDLGNVSEALQGKLIMPRQILNHKGKPVHWEGAISKLFMGAAFFVIAIVLGLTGAGRGWWYWMLIPAFSILGGGVAQYIQLKKLEKRQFSMASDYPASMASNENASLPPPQTEFLAPESRYKTGDLVPPSVTDKTTRQLELDSEGKTMSLPKK